MKNKTIGMIHPDYVGLFLADCELRLNRAGIYKARILDTDWQNGSTGEELLLLIIHASNVYNLSVDYSKGPDRTEVDIKYNPACNAESLNIVSEIILSSHYLMDLP